MVMCLSKPALLPLAIFTAARFLLSSLDPGRMGTRLYNDVTSLWAEASRDLLCDLQSLCSIPLSEWRYGEAERRLCVMAAVLSSRGDEGSAVNPSPGEESLTRVHTSNNNGLLKVNNSELAESSQDSQSWTEWSSSASEYRPDCGSAEPLEGQQVSEERRPSSELQCLSSRLEHQPSVEPGWADFSGLVHTAPSLSCEHKPPPPPLSTAPTTSSNMLAEFDPLVSKPSVVSARSTDPNIDTSTPNWANFEESRASHGPSGGDNMNINDLSDFDPLNPAKRETLSSKGGTTDSVCSLESWAHFELDRTKALPSETLTADVSAEGSGDLDGQGRTDRLNSGSESDFGEFSCSGTSSMFISTHHGPSDMSEIQSQAKPRSHSLPLHSDVYNTSVEDRGALSQLSHDSCRQLFRDCFTHSLSPETVELSSSSIPQGLQSLVDQQ